MTKARLVLAIVSTLAVEAAFYVIWRWVLPEFDIQMPLWTLIAVMVFWAVFAVVDFIFVTHIIRRQTVVGLPTMVGSKGKARRPRNPEKFRGLVHCKNFSLFSFHERPFTTTNQL